MPLLLEPIVTGCHWEATFEVGPSSGETEADVTSWLTGATIEAHIEQDDGTPIVTVAGQVVDPLTRLISLSLTNADTTPLTPGEYHWDVRVVTAEARYFPLHIGLPARISARGG